MSLLGEPKFTSANLCSECGVSCLKKTLRVVKLGVDDFSEFRIFCTLCLAHVRRLIKDDLVEKLDITREQVAAISRLNRSAAYGARMRRIPFHLAPADIATAWVKQKGLCALTGRRMLLEDSEAHNWSNASVDRIDSLCSYRQGNIQLVCWAVNLMKNSLSMEEFGDWCKAVVIHALEETQQAA